MLRTPVLRVARSLDLCISVKLTQLGLDFSNELCVENLEQVLRAANEAATIVMIDRCSTVCGVTCRVA